MKENPRPKGSAREKEKERFLWKKVGEGGISRPRPSSPSSPSLCSCTDAQYAEYSKININCLVYPNIHTHEDTYIISIFRMINRILTIKIEDHYTRSKSQFIGKIYIIIG